MHAFMLEYSLRAATPAEHAELREQLAPAFAAVRGLVSKTWHANDDRGRYGGFYVFADKPSFDAFVASELYETVRSHTALTDLVTNDYAINERATAVTSGPASALVHA